MDDTQSTPQVGATPQVGVYKTTDIFLAAFLGMSGHYPGIKQLNGKKCEFGFNDDEDLQNFVKAYYSGQAKVEPVAFTTAIRQLKSRIYGLFPSANKKRRKNRHHRGHQGGDGGQTTPASPKPVAGGAGATPAHRTDAKPDHKVVAKGGTNGQAQS